MYTSTTTNYGQLTDKIFIKDSIIGFDFSKNSPVTFITFDGAGGWGSKLSKRMLFWGNLFHKHLGHHVNVVCIRDGNRNFNHYSVNFLGLQGICENFADLGNLLNEKLYLKGSTRRTLVFGDCGGAVPAMLTSTIVPYHSILLTNPILEIERPGTDFSVSTHSSSYIKKISNWLYENLPEYRDYFDSSLIYYLDKFTDQPNTSLDLHWASSVTGIELYYKNQAEFLKLKSNVKIQTHVIDIDAHLLQPWLISKKLYTNYALDIARQEFAFLNIDTLPIRNSPSGMINIKTL